MVNVVPSDNKSTRRRTGAALAAALLGSGAAAFFYSRFVEPRTLLVRSFELALPSIPPGLDGCTIAFLSDFHLGGPGDGIKPVGTAFDLIQQRRPDLILLGGDFFDQGVRAGREPDWSRLPAIAPTFAVPGNHDYKSSPDATELVLDVLDDAGISVLRNRGCSVSVRNGCIDLIGVDDPYTYRADFASANSGLALSENPRILLAHAGMVTEELPVGAADLILSGHTHGAQIRVSPFRRTGPFDAFWWLDHVQGKRVSHFRQGLFWVRGSLLYVGNGIGMTSYGLRFLAPPELAFFTLRHGTGDPEYPCDDPRRYTLRSDQTRYWTWPETAP
jgi:uncharacterized protein